ncbi:MAG: methyltransferase domain-containing protein [Oscillospiraceae bacterium]|nr:methyltransferase domain-containing protein [Oscillospiraceae bacterium]
MVKSELICPICGRELETLPGGFRCKNRHTFDRAAKGYTNFLLPSQTKGKIPGDNKQMVDARRDFLDLGLYRLLSDTLNREAIRWLRAEGIASPRILDAGCGEGYYTAGLRAALDEAGIGGSMVGMDISKFALAAACRRTRGVEWGVASLFEMPVENGWADLLLNIFAPYSEEEFGRVLRKNGLLIMVFPGPRHLYGLKEILYEVPYENDVKHYQLKDFTFTGRVTVGDTVTVTGAQNIQNLFSMTPYYWKSSPEASARLARQESLVTEIQFDLLFYRKEKNPGKRKMPGREGKK